jgi:hypothetical protein
VSSEQHLRDSVAAVVDVSRGRSELSKRSVGGTDALPSST